MVKCIKGWTIDSRSMSLFGPDQSVYRNGGSINLPVESCEQLAVTLVERTGNTSLPTKADDVDAYKKAANGVVNTRMADALKVCISKRPFDAGQVCEEAKNRGKNMTAEPWAGMCPQQRAEKLGEFKRILDIPQDDEPTDPSLKNSLIKLEKAAYPNDKYAMMQTILKLLREEASLRKESVSRKFHAAVQAAYDVLEAD